MIYVRQPTDEEGAELRRMTRQEVGRVSQRAQMVLLSAQRRTVPEIATLFETSRATVRLWLRRFEAAGPSGLLDTPRSGRPRKVTPQVEATLGTWLRQDPQRVQASYVATCWTVAMLVLAVGTQLAVTISPSTLRTALHRLELRWRRPRLAMPRKTDPEKAQKQWRIAEAVITAGPEAAVLYADESRVQTPGPGDVVVGRAAVARVDARLERDARPLRRPGDPHRPVWTYLVRERMRKEDFLAFLAHLLVVYPTQPIVLIVDNYSSHTAGDVREWLAAHPRLQLHFLPKYCSHLNPVERIWLQLKGHLAGNRLYGSIRLLLTTVDRCFVAMTPEQALTWAAAEK